ncbi:MAG: hypothetical protein ACFE8B_01575 [Candidatus Hermodarchaeota archaeon]
MKKIVQFIKTNKRLVFAYSISISIQIIFIIGFIVYNLTSQIPQNSLVYEFFRVSLEPYQDYQIWYKSFVDNFVYKDWVPYSFSFPDIELYTDWFSYLWDLFVDIRYYYYIYPPFFLYILSLPGIFHLNLIFIPLLAATNLLPIVLYKFLSNSFNKKIAEWGFLATSLCPILIFYNGGLLLNTSLVSLFFIITLYLISTQKFKAACIFLSISFLFKQIILFFILPALTYMILQSCKREENKFVFKYFKKLLLYSSIIIGTVFLGSLPWIFINPYRYFNSIFLTQSIRFNPVFIAPHHNTPVHWYSFLIVIDSPYWFLYIVGFLTFTSIGILITEILVVVLMYYWYSNDKLNWVKFLDIIVYVAVLSHLLFPRGVYKYYFTFHVPLIILWLAYHYYEALTTNSNKNLRLLGYFVIISLAIILIPRFYYLLLIWTVLILIIRKSLNEQKKIET